LRTLALDLLYIYQVEEKNEEPSNRYIVITASKEEAIELVEKDCNRQELLEWSVEKIGIATNHYNCSVILMKGI
jgi:hypothetical protein